MRDHYTPEQRRAASILDAVRAGADIENDEIVWALITLGEQPEWIDRS